MTMHSKNICHEKTHCSHPVSSASCTHKELEALGELRPPWPRQLVTLILPTVKMLSLGGERLTPIKGFGSLPAPRSGYAHATAMIVFFCKLA